MSKLHAGRCDDNIGWWRKEGTAQGDKGSLDGSKRPDQRELLDGTKNRKINNHMVHVGWGDTAEGPVWTQTAPPRKIKNQVLLQERGDESGGFHLRLHGNGLRSPALPHQELLTPPGLCSTGPTRPLRSSRVERSSLAEGSSAALLCSKQQNHGTEEVIQPRSH